MPTGYFIAKSPLSISSTKFDALKNWGEPSSRENVGGAEVLVYESNQSSIRMEYSGEKLKAIIERAK
ncbi:MAG: hypothetical protein WC661_01305 [Opitutaceae bacterium]|jgi:hypothetical protein